jgi:large-conductance mechanosensitive channel
MDLKDFSLRKFASFMKKENILSISISFVIAGMMKEIILKLTNEVILPISKGKSLKSHDFSEFIILFINLIIVSYLLFVINSIINFSIKTTLSE